MALDIVDWAIIIVGLTMLPMIPDLLGNILIAFLPDSYVTASVRRWYAPMHYIFLGRSACFFRTTNLKTGQRNALQYSRGCGALQCTAITGSAGSYRRTVLGGGRGERGRGGKGGGLSLVWWWGLPGEGDFNRGGGVQSNTDRLGVMHF